MREEQERAEQLGCVLAVVHHVSNLPGGGDPRRRLSPGQYAVRRRAGRGRRPGQAAAASSAGRHRPRAPAARAGHSERTGLGIERDGASHSGQSAKSIGWASGFGGSSRRHPRGARDSWLSRSGAFAHRHENGAMTVPVIETAPCARRTARRSRSTPSTSRVEPRRGVRVPRPERRRQDDRRQAAAGPDPPERRRGARCSGGRSAIARPAAGSATCRSCSATRPGSRPARSSSSTRPSPASRAATRHAGDRAGPRSWPASRRAATGPDRRLLEGDAAAARPGRGAPGRPGARDPRRADVRARPGRARRRADDHPRGARARLHGPAQLAPAGRGGAAVRPRRGGPPRARRRRRVAGRPAGRARGAAAGHGPARRPIVAGRVRRRSRTTMAGW